MASQDKIEVKTAPEALHNSSADVLPTSRKRSAAAAAAMDNSDDLDSKKSKLETIDLAVSLGFKAGDRIEVEWEVAEGDEDGVLNTRWWGSTLKAHDGRTTSEGLAIRVLDYDPYPEGGFLQSSLEEVVFVSPNALVLPDSLEHQTSDVVDELHFRREGEDETVTMNDESLREHLNDVLVDIMKAKRITTAFRNMDAAQQAQFAELIANGKEKLIETMQAQWDRTRKVITPEDIPGIMEQAFGYREEQK
jgi:hypothetical protein